MQCPFLCSVQGSGTSNGWNVGALLRRWPLRESPFCPAAGKCLVRRWLGEFQDFIVSIQLQAHLTFFSGTLSRTRGEMASHSSTLAWKIPWMEEPGGPQSMGSLRVRQDSATSLSLFTFLNWRRQWQPTPVFLPGESQGRESLVGCRLWGRTELDTTEAT